MLGTAVVFTIVRAATYVALGIGFALVFGAGRVLNLSHGALFLLTAYVAHALAGAGLPLPLVYLVAVGATSVAGVALYRLALRDAAASPDRAMVLCLALNFLLGETLRALWGTRAIAVPALLRGSVDVLGAIVPRQQLLVVPLAAGLLGVTAWVLHRTKIGRAVRAVAQDREGARAVGISAQAVIGWAFGAGAATAAMSSCVLAPLEAIGPAGWIMPLVKSFAVVVLGGADRLRGLVAAAITLAVVEVGAAAALSETAADQVAFAAVVLLLLLRPRGLSG